jgi:uncharacterized protein DUF6483
MVLAVLPGNLPEPPTPGADPGHKHMIRRDYILRMIEEFMQVLSRLQAMKRGELWSQASTELDAGFQRLVASGAAGVAQLSETELLARLLQGEPTAVVRTKTRLLVTLLKEAGEFAAEQNRLDESRSYYLKGLHLLLRNPLGTSDPESPEFVPSVEAFVAALAEAPLPLQTQALLMQHFEGTGQLAKAEDALYRMLEIEPKNPAIVEFGITFYQRLGSQSEARLAAGNLPRREVEAGLAELRRRQESLKV